MTDFHNAPEQTPMNRAESRTDLTALLAEAQSLCDAATKGAGADDPRWCVRDMSDDEERDIPFAIRSGKGNYSHEIGAMHWQEDADFCARARTLVPDLVAAIRELQSNTESKPAEILVPDKGAVGSPEHDLHVIAARLRADLHEGAIRHSTSWCVARLTEIAAALSAPQLTTADQRGIGATGADTRRLDFLSACGCVELTRNRVGKREWSTIEQPTSPAPVPYRDGQTLGEGDDLRAAIDAAIAALPVPHASPEAAK